MERTTDKAYWIDVVATLKDNPGKSGKTGPHAVGVANHIRNGRYAAFVPDKVTEKDEYAQRHWNVTARKADPVEGRKRQWVYVTWTGQDCPCRWCHDIQE